MLGLERIDAELRALRLALRRGVVLGGLSLRRKGRHSEAEGDGDEEEQRLSHGYVNGDARAAKGLRARVLRICEVGCDPRAGRRRSWEWRSRKPASSPPREVDDLYRRHGGEVYRYAYAVLGNHADAEDVTQTTFLNAYRSLEQGVRPRKPANWLLTIASNAIKQRFRQERVRPHQVELHDRIADTAPDDDDDPTMGELLAALSKIPPQQRQAIVLREFEGRSYAEVAEILGTTTTALETLLFRARRSLAEELEHQLTCTDAQLAISRAADGRLGRKERRRLRDHLAECPDCAHFARLQQRHRRALRGLMLVPIPLSLSVFKGMEGTATAAVVPAAGASVAAVGAGVGTGAGVTAATGSGLLGGGIALKAAAVVTAASVAGGVGVAGSSEVDSRPGAKKPALASKPGKRIGQVAPRGVLVPGNGVARGKATAPGQLKRAGGSKTGAATRTGNAATAPLRRRRHPDSRLASRNGRRTSPARASPSRRQARGLPHEADSARPAEAGAEVETEHAAAERRSRRRRAGQATGPARTPPTETCRRNGHHEAEADAARGKN